MAKTQFRRTVWALAVIPCLVVVVACGSQGDDAGDVRESTAADAVGVVTSVDKDAAVVSVGFAPDAGYEYFEGTTFDLATSGGLQDPDGLAADPNNLAVGDRIAVWAGMCQESFPVKCPDAVARIASGSAGD